MQNLHTKKIIKDKKIIKYHYFWGDVPRRFLDWGNASPRPPAIDAYGGGRCHLVDFVLQDRPEIFGWIEVRAVPWPHSSREAAEVLPKQLLPHLDCVRRKPILHENDLACVGQGCGVDQISATLTPTPTPAWKNRLRLQLRLRPTSVSLFTRRRDFFKTVIFLATPLMQIDIVGKLDNKVQ